MAKNLAFEIYPAADSGRMRSLQNASDHRDSNFRKLQSQP